MTGLGCFLGGESKEKNGKIRSERNQKGSFPEVQGRGVGKGGNISDATGVSKPRCIKLVRDSGLNHKGYNGW